MKSILVHICCANCACFPYESLKEEGFHVTGFWYNPNIHPYTEYERRLAAMKSFAGIQGLEVLYGNGYDVSGFAKNLNGDFDFPSRCESCYRMRLEAAALMAKSKNISLFTTTLLHSVHQKHELIMKIGEEIAGRHGLEFYYSDFRKGWNKGIEISKKLELYRQQYCGCIFSEKERYVKEK